METSPLRRSRDEPVQARGRRTRRNVLEAARRVFVRRGFEAARVEEITREARVGYGTFYKYYRDKQDVFDELMEGLFGELSEGLFPEHLETASLEEQIRLSMDKYLRDCHRSREALVALQAASSSSARVCKCRAELRERCVQWLVKEMVRLNPEDQTSQPSLEVLSRALLQVMESVAQDWMTNRRRIKMKVVAEALCEIWVRVLCNGRPPASRASG